ncbi:Uncharacterised protein [Legionella lansingensis]|uniref:Uncharacterized protein n=1 Tax=Legionella lansingensis TaxID=45067 RepID=A0A0W0VTB9_9GAMM|nr:hypothetical protein [Legionella lansingensis]KTD23403.1 hypothetical protein Llan_0902 [Legionella lansingensis]SNV49552.1 Uncharacterised protein [Legionella lansingensis]
MNFDYAKSILLATIIGLIPEYGNATQVSGQPQESFQSICLTSWMKRVDNIKDEVDYQNFGKKYCECADKHILDNPEDTNKITQLCLSQTILQDTMDSIENEVGLDKATEEDVLEYCEDKFELVFPTMSDSDKQISTAYCNCANPKLRKILEMADTMTESDYTKHINEVAAACFSGTENKDQNTSTKPAQTNETQNVLQ